MSRTHITLADLADLVDNQACSEQRDLFVATFGDKAKILPRTAGDLTVRELIELMNEVVA